MPQMSPMKWFYISIFCYLIFLILMILMNSLPMILIFKKKVNLKFKKWKWLW